MKTDDCDASQESQSALLAYGINNRTKWQWKSARRFPYQDRNLSFSRPSSDSTAERRKKNPRLAGVILYILYTPEDHYAPERTLNLRYKVQVIKNYEDLTEANKEAGPNDRYERLKNSAKMTAEGHTEEEVKNPEGGGHNSGWLH